MGEQSVASDDLSSQVHLFKQDSKAHKFVSLLAGIVLGDDDAELVAKGSHEMNARDEMASNTAKSFAIEGKGAGQNVRTTRKEPREQGFLKSVKVQIFEDVVEGSSTGSGFETVLGKAQERAKRVEMITSPLGDGRKAASAAEDSTSRERQ